MGETERRVIDLADVAGMLFDHENDTLAELNTALATSDFAVIASPTYKASYTGMLKAFLDRYETNGLAGVVAIPVMSGAGPVHTLAPDFTLRPLLVELGAVVPTTSLFFPTSQMDELEPLVDAWAERNRRALAALSGLRRLDAR